MAQSRWKQGAGPPVLVLASTASLAYSAARCLQDAGRPFQLMSRGRYSAARTSRWCVRGERFAQSGFDDDALARQVKEALGAYGLACVVPAGIKATLYLARHHDLFAPEQLFPLSPRPLLDQLNDKWCFYNLLASLGLCQPKTFLVESLDDLDGVTLTPPVVVKPLAGEGSQGVTVEGSGTGLRRRIEVAAVLGLLPLLVQEYIPGTDQGACALVNHGRVFACRVHRGRVGRSTIEYTQEQDVLEVLTTLVKATGFHGILDIDFRRDARDGSLRALECNPRLFGSAHIAASTGANFVEQGLGLAAGESIRSGVFEGRSGPVSTTVLSLPAGLRALVNQRPMSSASARVLAGAARDPLSTVTHRVESQLLRSWPMLAARILDEPPAPWRVTRG